VLVQERDQVREAERLGCWLVHNPRSNRGNRVGYAGRLAASRRVALGTDGYRSDMLEEVQALRQEARANGDVERRAEERLAAGGALMAERIGEVPERSESPAANLEPIAAEAAADSALAGRIRAAPWYRP